MNTHADQSRCTASIHAGRPWRTAQATTESGAGDSQRTRASVAVMSTQLHPVEEELERPRRLPGGEGDAAQLRGIPAGEISQRQPDLGPFRAGFEIGRAHV